jgi:hypothetical protein
MFHWIPPRLFLCHVLFNDVQYLGLCSVGWMIRRQEGVEGSRELLRTDEEKLRNNYLDRRIRSLDFNSRLPKIFDSFHYNKSCNENFSSHGVTIRNVDLYVTPCCLGNVCNLLEEHTSTEFPNVSVMEKPVR